MDDPFLDPAYRKIIESISPEERQKFLYGDFSMTTFEGDEIRVQRIDPYEVYIDPEQRGAEEIERSYLLRQFEPMTAAEMVERFPEMRPMVTIGGSAGGGKARGLNVGDLVTYDDGRKATIQEIVTLDTGNRKERRKAASLRRRA